ncbi:hypothetical protein TNIN_133911 [Trichonephila inaurata madagascariensis]|uniref:Uncharacterized protein n=1 Tax=Trichonephila inaurata madagascariensis TaxID=2747483 RepID=A0A8X6XKX7_9ARAC|nr:hypothetical protein TNIN_133911 [Trichonephila inaurata madagascariensis]
MQSLCFVYLQKFHLKLDKQEKQVLEGNSILRNPFYPSSNSWKWTTRQQWTVTKCQGRGQTSWVAPCGVNLCPEKTSVNRLQ